MASHPPRPGGEIDAWCTKCRLDLLHRIIAVHAGQIMRVECRTCGGHHNYRRQKTAPAPSGKARTARPAISGTSARAAAAAEAEQQRSSAWRQAVGGKPAEAFKPYRATQTYASGDLVRHGTFGDGYVTRITDRHKIEVMFKDGPRTLAQAIDG